MRLFLDANVLFSASLSSTGVGAGLVDLAAIGVCELLSSRLACDEAERNLRVKSPRALDRWGIVRAALTITPEADRRLRQRLPVDLLDNDLAVLAAAVAARAHVLVTGDRRHFGPLFDRTIGSTRVLAPRPALALLLSTIGT